MRFRRVACALLIFSSVTGVSAQEPAKQHSDAVAPAPPEVPAEYVIGPGDVLAIRFWRNNDVSSEVAVRPDGRISLMLLDDIQAAGLTPEQLRDRIAEKAKTLFEDARLTVVVREVRSKNVYITGLVGKPGPYPLLGKLTVLQLIAMAGGLSEFAGTDRIAIMRTVNGKQTGFKFNYDDVRNFKHLEQNIELQPGDTVLVP